MSNQTVKIVFLAVVLVAAVAAGAWYFLDARGDRSEESSAAPAGAPPVVEEGKFFGTNVSVTAEAGEFSPSEVTVNAGDGVIFKFTAADADYDLLIKLPEEVYMAAKKGKTVLAAFVAESGTYEFACRDLCPSGKKMTGTLTVR